MRVIRDAEKGTDSFFDRGLIKGNGRDFSIDTWQIDANPSFGHAMVSDDSCFDKIQIDGEDRENLAKFRNLLLQNKLKLNEFLYIMSYDDAQIVFCFDSLAVILLEGEEINVLDRFTERTYTEIDVKTLYILFIKKFVTLKQDYERVRYDLLRAKNIYISQNIDNYMVLPTLHCNARCFYCFEHLDEKSNMTTETAKKTGDFIVENSRSDTVVIRWFGGEPLMRPDVIDIISDKVNKSGKTLNAIITTNGSYINDAMIEKMKTSWHVNKVHLTLDGNESEHNRRKNYKDSNINGYRKTLDNVRKLLDAGLHVVCRLNMDADNMKCLDEILTDLRKYAKNPRFFVHTTTLYMPKYANPNGYFSKDNYEKVFTHMFNKLLEHGFIKDYKTCLPEKVVFRCTACMKNFIVIDPQGDLYKCEQEEKTQEHCVGNIYSGITYTPRLKYWLDPVLDEECGSCIFLPICQGGCKWRKSIGNDELTPCSHNIYQMKALCDYLYSLYKTGVGYEQ